MDVNAEALPHALGKLCASQRAVLPQLLLEEVEDFVAEFVSAVWTTLARHEAQQAPCREVALRLVDARPRATELGSDRRDRTPFLAHGPEHLVAGLDQVARVEERVVSKQRVGDALRVRIEGALRLHQRGLRLVSLACRHRGLRGWHWFWKTR